MVSQKKDSSTKNVFLIGLVSFFNDISSEMILPILPLLIAQLGGGGIAIGLIGGLRDSGADLLKVFFGHWSDKIQKRKVFMYFGYTLSAFFKLSLLATSTWYAIFCLIGLERIGKAIRTAPRDALITYSMPEQVGRAFGIHRAFDNLGAITGSLITFLLVWFANLNFTVIIFVAAIIGLISLFPISAISEPPVLPTAKTIDSTGTSFSKSFIRFTIIASIFSLANISYMFLILHAQNTLNHGAPTYLSMLLYVFFNIFYAAFAVPFGKLSDHIGRRIILLFGYGFFALTMFGFYYAHTLLFLGICFALYGISLAAINVNHKAYVADLATHHLKATSLGLFETITGLAVFFTGGLMGLLWEKIGHEFVFASAGCIALVACFLLGLTKKYT